ncbi:histone acetyltransferase type B catalytic subunit [Thelephora ganbajun]|uniref:Histone acetyltransferase type B catalytic subunit n=1 Tax=Thelephora ganbajun TaxID=370292 RepID=A0ACB6ZWW3_THEGA|nr:histone acetyltransferase type B catalytic subunit [Thelephora ganbajun]
MSTEWTADSNAALSLSLVRSQKDKESLAETESYENFSPTFTYPIYGEDEKIYGYKNLTIDLRFASGSLHQYLNVRYASKLSSSSTVDNVEATMSEFIPPGYETDEKMFLDIVERDAMEFKPLGTKIHSYQRVSPSSQGKGKGVASTSKLDPESEDVIEYEVYHSTWGTSGFRDYHRRMQIFIFLYIEAGSYIVEDESTWEFAVLYEKRKRRGEPGVVTYHFAGYSSLYPFYCFPERIRLRLSQFVILPPYQRQGHGSALYTAIYQRVLSQEHISELTVEDPAEAFEDLRDRNDLKMLLGLKQFMEEGFGTNGSSTGGGVGPIRRTKSSSGAGKMGPPANKAWTEKWRMQLKIAGRQFHRLVEMLQLLNLDPLDAKGFKAFRIQVKERLYRFNYEILVQLEKQERLDKLEETFQNVVEDYRRILAMIR